MAKRASQAAAGKRTATAKTKPASASTKVAAKKVAAKKVAKKAKAAKRAKPKPRKKPPSQAVADPIALPAAGPEISRSPSAILPDHAQPQLDESRQRQRKIRGKMIQNRVAKSGLQSKILGHVSARGRRQQARRDAKSAERG